VSMFWLADAEKKPRTKIFIRKNIVARSLRDPNEMVPRPFVWVASQTLGTTVN
jgi:hypothetical protein